MIKASFIRFIFFGAKVQNNFVAREANATKRHGIRINKKTEKYRLHKQVKTKFPKRLTSLSDKIFLLYDRKTILSKNKTLRTTFLASKRQHLTDISVETEGFSRGNRQTSLWKKKKKPTTRKAFVQFFSKHQDVLLKTSRYFEKTCPEKNEKLSANSLKQPDASMQPSTTDYHFSCYFTRYYRIFPPRILYKAKTQLYVHSSDIREITGSISLSFLRLHSPVARKKRFSETWINSLSNQSQTL